MINGGCGCELKAAVKSDDDDKDSNGFSKRFKVKVTQFDMGKSDQIIAFKLDDNLEKEFKQGHALFEVQLRLVDKKHNKSFPSAVRTIPIRIDTRGFFYKCTFTNLNGIGRRGPTEMKDYKGKLHAKDTQLDSKQKGMQLWTVPQTGTWKVVCYAAQGGDSILAQKNEYMHGDLGAIVGGAIKLYRNDVIKILVGQVGDTNKGRGGTYFVLYRTGGYNPNHNYNESNVKNNTIINKPLIIASGGNGADVSYVNGISGLGIYSENRNNYGGYKSNGNAARGASFKNDFNIFVSNVSKCNASSFIDGGIGGEQGSKYSGKRGGFGGGGSGGSGGGGGGGYIGGLVAPEDNYNTDQNKYSLYGGLSYNVCQNNCMKIMVSGGNKGNGKIEVAYWKG